MSRDLLNHGGNGKGSRPRTDLASKAYQDGYDSVNFGRPLRQFNEWTHDTVFSGDGFQKKGPGRYRKIFKATAAIPTEL